MLSRTELSFEAWCWRLWQTHPRRRRGMAPHYTFPTHRDFRIRWPRLARDLIVAEWRIGGAWLPAGVVEGIDIEVLDPPASRREDWRRLYAAELDEHPAVLRDLVGENPVAAVARRAQMWPAELDAFRMWAAGSSIKSIARGLGRHRKTIQEALERARGRLRRLATPPTGVI